MKPSADQATDESQTPPADGNPHAGSDSPQTRSEPGLAGIVRESPVSSAALALSIIAGAVLGFVLLGEDLSTARRILGGAVAGGGCWLLVMMGRVI